MKKTAFSFGLYGVYVILAVFLISWLIVGQNSSSKAGLVIGWAGIVLSVSLVYFGIKYFRDKCNGGSLSFGEGIKLGLLIVLFPAFAFGVLNVLYVMVLDPGYLDRYYAAEVASLRNTLPPAEFTRRVKEIQDQRIMFSNPVVQFIVMFLNVFIVGLILTVISTLILKKKSNSKYSMD